MQGKVLVVEDDEFKRDSVINAIKQARPLHSIEVACSVQSAISLLQVNEYTFIILDMALPSHDSKVGGGPVASMLSGGLEIILEMSYLERNDDVIILTQYPEIEIEGKLIALQCATSAIREHLAFEVRDVILYEHDSDVWNLRLLDIIREIP